MESNIHLYVAKYNVCKGIEIIKKQAHKWFNCVYVLVNCLVSDVVSNSEWVVAKTHF